MDHQFEVALIQNLLDHLDANTTAMADEPWENEVAVYTDSQHLKLEEKVLFREYPQFICFGSELAEPGSYKTDDYTGAPILVVRGTDGKLRAFLNVCRHRGVKVADGCGKARLFVCPFHAWTYELDGKVRGMPDERSFEGVREARSSLIQLPVCEKYGLVWVIPSPSSTLLHEFNIDPWLNGLEKELSLFNFQTWSYFDRRIVHEPMNWKVAADTFHEVYHVGFLHRESLKTVLFSNVADFKTFGPNHRMSIPRRKLDALRNQPKENWDLMWNTALVYCLFPNTILMVQGDHVELARLYPVEGRVDRCLMDMAIYTPEASTTEKDNAHWSRNMDLVMKVVTGEDFPVGRTMQIGFNSGAQSRIVYGRNEPALIHFHKSLRRAFKQASLNNASPAEAAE